MNELRAHTGHIKHYKQTLVLKYRKKNEKQAVFRAQMTAKSHSVLTPFYVHMASPHGILHHTVVPSWSAP
jgi:hypothetical protein